MKAMERSEKNYEELYSALAGTTAVMFCEVGNVPAKLIKEFRKAGDKPQLKAAFVEECSYLGDNQLDTLISIKSKNELIGDIIGLLQSPAKNVISALQSGGGKIAGIVKTLSERNA
jgi:large subunit ribosomal protein L10